LEKLVTILSGIGCVYPAVAATGFTRKTRSILSGRRPTAAWQNRTPKGAGSAPEPIGAKPGHSRGGDMSYIASTPSHCPGFTTLKNLKSFSCKCPNCGELKEIFSDEFARPQKCLRCGQDIDFSKCTLEGAAMFNEPA
jgi:hypothetical protein